MKKGMKVFLVTAGFIMLSAVLAPLVYQILPQFKFEKIFNRLLMISIIASCFLFVRLDRNFIHACGFSQPKQLIPHWLIGFFVSIFILIGLVLLELGIGAVLINHDQIPTFAKIAMALVTGLSVGAIEEFFFRGFIFLKFKQSMGWLKSLVLTNLIYSSVHFIKNGRPLIEGPPTIYDSFRVLGASFNEFLNWGEFWPGFVGLFLFGVVLSVAFKRSGALFVPMGIHAGAVTFLKMTNRLVVPSPDVSMLIFGGKGFYSGILGWLFIGLIAVVICTIFRSSGKECATEY